MKITEFGLIGEKLPHSYSAEIHKKFRGYDYRLCELKKEELPLFFEERAFHGINVTIPYKKDVLPYLSHIDPKAKSIGAVNTIVNRDGALFGYNTDYYGLSSLFSLIGVSPKGKKAMILGTGGTSRTALAVLRDAGAAVITVVSRTESADTVSYEKAMTLSDTEILINTTPVGMFPDPDGCPIDLRVFPRLCGVVDAIYNPLRTNLVLDARALGIPAVGGLSMLVAQAQAASRLFLEEEPNDDREIVRRVTDEIRKEKENIVLVGMPTSGKSTIGKAIALETGREFFDADAVFEEKCSLSAADYIRQNGEEAFRKKETEILAFCANRSGAVIATGGGAVLKSENKRTLSRNGRIFFIDRSPEKLLCSGDRPLSATREALKKLYDTRYRLYLDFCDEKVDGDGTIEETAREILLRFNAEKEDF